MNLNIDQEKLLKWKHKEENDKKKYRNKRASKIWETISHDFIKLNHGIPEEKRDKIGQKKCWRNNIEQFSQSMTDTNPQSQEAQRRSRINTNLTVTTTKKKSDT